MSSATPPSDYRLLVPRDWFRVDLTHERWRGHLKTFVDREAARGHATSQARRSVWTTLRNTAEGGVARGALEFFLKTESPEPRAAGLPASLMVSLLPAPRGLAPETEDFARTLAGRRDEDGDGGGDGDGTSKVTTVSLPAGDTVRVVTDTALQFHVRMPGGVGHLLLAFSLPLSGTEGPMADLCEAIASSLRWT